MQDDSTTRQKIIDVLDHQFDLEILLKHREARLIEEEILRVEEVQEDLKFAILKENNPPSSEHNHYTRYSRNYHNNFLVFHQPPISTNKVFVDQKSPTPRHGLYGRLEDGTYVRWSCPVCRRDDLANSQGFLNHCRLAHNLIFSSHQEVNRIAGTPVDESEVPLDHPCRRQPVTKPIDLAKTEMLSRPTIKVFEEDVDISDEFSRESSMTMQNRNIGLTKAVYAPDPHIHNISLLSYSPDSDVKDDGQDEKFSLHSYADSIRSSDVDLNGEINSVSEEEDRMHWCSSLTDSNYLAEQTNKDVEDVYGSKETIKEPTRDGKHQQSIETAFTIDTSESSLTSLPSTSLNQPQQIYATSPSQSPNLAVPQLASNSDTSSGSRFHTTCRLLIGNTSKYIPPNKRPADMEALSHKWMVYIATPMDNSPNIASFVKKVRFFLHPSYRPYDVVDVKIPPFRLTRMGWGEFPVRMKLFFVDGKRNKPIDVIHILKLDGRQVLGAERTLVVELDRNTEFRVVDQYLNENREAEKDRSSREKRKNLGRLAISGPTKNQDDELSPLDKLLTENVSLFPIIKTVAADALRLPYSVASSTKTFFSWPVGRRKSVERHRAYLLRLHIQQKVSLNDNNDLKVAIMNLTTKNIIKWCKKMGHTPIHSGLSLIEANDAIEKLQHKSDQSSPFYCKSCGCPFAWHTSSTCKRRPKEMINRTSRISNITRVNEIFQELGKDWDTIQEQDDMTIEISSFSHQSLCDSGSSNNSYSSSFMDYATESPTAQMLFDAHMLDWIWGVVGQLKLTGVIANKLVITKDGTVGIEEGNMNAAVEQRIVVGKVLLDATRMFLSTILKRSTTLFKSEQETDPSPLLSSLGTIPSDVPTRKLLTPLHIYKTLQEDPDLFDFLTNRYMSNE